MFIWRMFGSGLEDLFIKAASFDDALAQARLVNPKYSGGQVHEVLEKKVY